MSDNLIINLFNHTIKFDTESLIKIKNNFHEFKNKTLEEIYPKNDWMRIKNNNYNGRIHFVDTKSKEFNINLAFGLSVNLNVSHHLDLKTYKCLKTNYIAYTLEYNYNEILHPFLMIKHDYLLTDVDSMGANYKCKKCNILGHKKKNAKSNEIVVRNQNELIYSCDEFIIKNIIE